MTLMKYARHDYPTVSPGMDIIGCARLMREHDIRLLPAVAAGRLAGIITLSDIVFRSIADGVDWFLARVSDFMTSDPNTCETDTPPAQALSLMQTLEFAALPVVDGVGNYLGIVFRHDLTSRLRMDPRFATTRTHGSSPSKPLQVLVQETPPSEKRRLP